MRKTLLALCLILAFGIPSNAQFYLAGDDPAHLKWYSLETPHYKIIFPKGADSLARVYGRSLEQMRPAVGRSLSLTPGEKRSRKMPVVLHTHNMFSNGSMGWAPSRMDLFSIPESDGSDPVSWNLQLTAHEPRHQSQMEFAQRGFMPWLIGESWAPAHWQLFLEQSIAEGDAVVTETGILNAGTRARTADFLNFYRVSLDQGQYRNWDRWRYGSYKHFTPDLYKLGYITVAGARTLYDDPLIVRKALDQSWSKPWMLAPANMQSQIRKHSGKSFKDSVRDILDSFNAAWQADAESRAPFMPMEQVSSPDGGYAMDYGSPQMLDNVLYVLREGNRQPREIITFNDGVAKHLKGFSSTASTLYAEENLKRIYWSEKGTHPRWSLDGGSIVRYYDCKSGQVRELTRGTRYFNPQPSPEGDRLAVAEYPVNGQHAAVVIDALTGDVLQRYPAPDGFQPSELAWTDDGTLYAACISSSGTSIWKIKASGTWEQVLAPSAQKIVNLGNGDEYIEWVSDRTGVNELYYFYPVEGRLMQMTNTRYGATDYCEVDDYMYYSVQTLDGMMLFRTPLDKLTPKEVSYSEVYSYPIEAKLTAQERALGPAPDLNADVPMSAPKRYSKLLHPLRLHSWMPFYVNYDAVKESSMDLTYETASIGLTGFFQNNLGTLSGTVGYGLHPDPDIDGRWRNSLHAKLIYSGLYPVFEASIDFGDQAASQFTVAKYTSDNSVVYGINSHLRDAPLLTGNIRAYIPLSCHKSDLLWGFTPQLSYGFSNNYFAPTPVVYDAVGRLEGIPPFYTLEDVGDRTSFWMQRMTASMRGYLMHTRADSQVYPRFGIGLEAGVSMRYNMQHYFAPNIYGYAYGYLPGFTRVQGLRLSALLQSRMTADLFGELAANTIPRGFDDGVSHLVGRTFQTQFKMTADYAIPIYVGDISIPWVAYIKNFLLTPHADFTALESFRDNLWSVGADFSASLARLFVLPFESSVGVSFSYLGGSWYGKANQEKPWSVELIFGVDF